MTRIIIAALFISITICSFGQKSFGIKVYHNTDIFEVQYYEGRTNSVDKSDKINFNRISLAVDIHTKKDYVHEIEFLIPKVSKSYENIQYPMNYEFQKKRPDFIGQISSYSLRYELSRTLTDKTKKLAFDLGIGVNPYYVLVEYIPTAGTRYYSSNKLYGFVLNIVPRIKYKVSPRFCVDLNAPFKIYNLEAEKFQVKNPALPLDQQTTLEYSNIFFEPVYTFRLGLIYSLNK